VSPSATLGHPGGSLDVSCDAGDACVEGAPARETDLKPFPFAYVKPRTLAQAHQLLESAGDKARILAGGQSLIAALNLRLSAPDLLVDITGLTDLSGIDLVGDRLRIGALTRHRDVETSDLVRRHAPLIAQAMPHVAHPAIRNRGTFGGSIALADPAAELPACVVALDAEIEMASPAGTRRLAADAFFRGIYETALRPGEVVTAVELPIIAAGFDSAFAELARRHGDYAMVGVAAHGWSQAGYLRALRLAFFGAGPKPLRARGAEARLVGAALTAERIAQAKSALGHDLDPFDDLQATAATKLHLAGVLLERVLRTLVKSA
jgi:aerobic carbon-monoxide dehydrogenase medium subunit